MRTSRRLCHPDPSQSNHPIMVPRCRHIHQWIVFFLNFAVFVKDAVWKSQRHELRLVCYVQYHKLVPFSARGYIKWHVVRNGYCGVFTFHQSCLWWVCPLALVIVVSYYDRTINEEMNQNRCRCSCSIDQNCKIWGLTSNFKFFGYKSSFHLISRAVIIEQGSWLLQKRPLIMSYTLLAAWQRSVGARNKILHEKWIS